MGLVKEEAIILSTRPFGESDKIVRFYTLGSGKLTGIAKGGKKSQKRFMNTLESFNCVRIEYFEKATSSMVRIENADLDQSNSGLEKSFRKVCTASFFTEFVDRLTKEKQKNEHLFHALKVILHNLKHVEFTVSDILYYELQMLDFLGYKPNLATCVQCGKELADAEKLYFSRERGGTVCLGCSRSLPHRQYPQGFISRMSVLDIHGPNGPTGPEGPAGPEGQAGLSRASTGFERLGRQILEDFVCFHLAVELKSYRLLKSIAG